MKKKKNECKLCNQKWHSFKIEDVYEELKSEKNGLSHEEAQKRIKYYGTNTLPSKAPVTLWEILLHQILNPLIFILIAAAIASMLIGEAVDAMFIFIVIALNSGLGTYQEYNAEKSASSLQEMLKIKAKVRREGKEIEIASEMIVPGDIVILETGNKVPADIRLIESNNLSADESFLTGESIAAEKHIDILIENIGVSERKNMVFAGATITMGRAIGIVVSTGEETQVGIIAQSVVQSETAKPPLVLRMEKFTKNISIIVVFVSIALAIILRMQGYDLYSIFFFVVALAVSAIPEGLPVALTVALSIASKRMSKRNVIVRRLNAVESLGSCTVIASDKTGTLTVNQQTAREILLPDGHIFKIMGEGYNGIGDVKDAIDNNISADDKKCLVELVEMSIISNEGNLTEENGKWVHSGDAMDVAFLSMAYKIGINYQEVRDSFTKIGEIPYESENKYSATFFKKNSINYVALKGALETIITFCKYMKYEDTVKEIDTNLLMQQSENLASKGLRVLAVAGGEIGEGLSKYDETSLRDLTFYGLVGFIDPLRPEAIDSVEKCKNAGLKVLMITGDHPSTAKAIATDLGLTKDKDVVVTGEQLYASGSPDSPAYAELVESSNVFARVAPNQKLEIVDVLIKRGEFVAVTGDGVNDTPALKRANIGVAMGSGTDAAKEVGSMIIVDDNFSSIVAGIEEGRFAYDNVRKVIYLLISTGAAEVVLFVAAILAQLPLPLLAVQLLWLNLVTNGIQDVALAFEGGEDGAMKRKPRKTNERIFNKQMINQTVVSGVVMGTVSFIVWYWLINIQQMEEASARNIILLLLVLLQNIHVFSCRSEHTSAFRTPISKNYILVFGVLLAQGIHILSMQLPFMQNILRMEKVSINNWLVLLALASAILLAMEIFKLLNKRVNNK